MRRRPLIAPQSGLRTFARFTEDGVLPSWLSCTRAACPASRQSAPAVDGTTFIEYNAAWTANTVRQSYIDSLGCFGLLVEPQRTNIALYSNFVDVAPADECPDNWTPDPAAGVDQSVEAGGPHGGDYFQMADPGVAARGVYRAITLAGATGYVSSQLLRRPVTGAAPATMYGHYDPGTGWFNISVPAAASEWTRRSIYGATIGGGAGCYHAMRRLEANDGVVQVSQPQLEAGAWRTSWIPTSGGTGTRFADAVAIAPDVFDKDRGEFGVVWVPDHSNNPGTDTDVRLVELDAAGWQLRWSWALGQFVMYYNAFGQSAALTRTFNALEPHFVRLRYGSAGVQMTVINLATGVTSTATNGTAWTAPTVAASLGGWQRSHFLSFYSSENYT